MRSYDEYCSIAKSLDVVGDRWTLLLVRELAERGPSRYTDLRNGLPGIATNLLAERLRELERADVIAREEAPPPIATTLFRLTERGEQLQPVLDGLTRWGLPLMLDQKPNDAVRSHWLASALGLMLRAPWPEDEPVTLELRIEDQPFVLELRDGAVQTRLGSAESPDATVTGPAKGVMGLVLGLVEPRAAKESGLTYEGDPAALERIRALAPSFAPPS